MNSKSAFPSSVGSTGSTSTAQLQTANLVASTAHIGPIILFASITALDVAYVMTQASWTARLSFWLLPVACILALVVIFATWRSAWQQNLMPSSIVPLSAMWQSPLAEVITMVFALSWWFRREAPDTPNGIALMLAFIGLGIMVWAGTRRRTNARP